jgi:hypothetical protein
MRRCYNRRGLSWWMELLTNYLYTRLGTTSNYSATDNLHIGVNALSSRPPAYNISARTTKKTVLLLRICLQRRCQETTSGRIHREHSYPIVAYVYVEGAT